MHSPRTLCALLALTLIPWLAGAQVRAQGALAEKPVTPAVQCLTLAQAQAAIVDDAKDPGGYFSQMQTMEMETKTGAALTGATLEEQRKECRARYQAGVVAFTAQEQAALVAYLGDLYPKLAEAYPGFAATPWRFIKLADAIEGGLPHTRGDNIVLPAGLCRALAMLRTLPPGHPAHREIWNLLLHEQMHVYQRAHPALFEALYTKAWGFEKAESITGCPWLTEHHLANPDGTDCRWVMPVKRDGTAAYVWPLVVLSDGPGPKRMPADFSMRSLVVEKKSPGVFAVKTDEKGRPAGGGLMEETQYAAVFGGSSNIYHPHEACADLFARMAVDDLFGAPTRPGRADSPAMKKVLAALRTWCAAHLGQ